MSARPKVDTLCACRMVWMYFRPSTTAYDAVHTPTACHPVAADQAEDVAS